jgi:hypothetical protein
MMPEIIDGLEDRFVLFLDFLGFSEAATHWEANRAQPLIDLLTYVAASQSPFSLDGGSLQDGGYKLKVRPETVTFSDHIVASYPLHIDESEPLKLLWLDILVQDAQRIVGDIALRALKLGLLVRGGITIGKLYHANGVVFGEGMVDAYRLESGVANYPRVVISPRVFSRASTDTQRRILTDRDGIFHLNYLWRMVGESASSGPTFLSEREKWKSRSVKTIDRTITRLWAAERWNEYAKWQWFKEQFNLATRDIIDLPAEDDGGPDDIQ